MRFHNRAQTGTEYIVMTVVVLVIVIIVVNLMGGIPGIGGSSSSTVTLLELSTAKIGVMDYSRFSEYVSLTLRNNLNDPVRITDVKISGTTCYFFDNISGYASDLIKTDVRLNPGDAHTLYCAGLPEVEVGEGTDETISIEYLDILTETYFTQSDESLSLIGSVAQNHTYNISEFATFEGLTALRTTLFVAHTDGYGYFIGYDTTNGNEIRKTNGAYVELIEDLAPGFSYGAFGSDRTIVSHTDGYVYFGGSTGNSKYHIYRASAAGLEYVGQSGGPYNLTFGNTTYYYNLSSNPIYLTSHDGYVYFQGNNFTSGYELWRTNGTGAEIVADIYSGSSSSYPTDLVSHTDGFLYFEADDGVDGSELWRTNGTTTEQVADIRSGAWSSYPSWMTSYSDGYVYFQADDGSVGTEVWRSNGTTTELFADIRSGASNSGAKDFTVHSDGYLYYRAHNGTTYMMYRTDGTTNEIVDAINGTNGYYGITPNMISAGGNLYYNSDSATYGDELHKFDGVTETLVVDLATGTADLFHGQCCGIHFVGTHLYLFGYPQSFVITDP